MTEHRKQVDRRKRRGHPRQSQVWWWALGIFGGAAVVAVIAVLSRLGGDTDGAELTTSEPRQVGSVSAAVTRIDLGRVPLDRWVNPSFRLRNVSAEPVSITVPKEGVEALEGC